jgi:hypothetical protein
MLEESIRKYQNRAIETAQQEKATLTILEQAELLCRDIAA